MPFSNDWSVSVESFFLPYDALRLDRHWTLAKSSAPAKLDTALKL